mgnify:CR=1 FL=1
MADPAENRKSSVMIEAASCVYPFYSIYSVLSELLALKISSHIEFVLPDMRKDKPPFAEKVIKPPGKTRGKSLLKKMNKYLPKLY